MLVPILFTEAINWAPTYVGTMYLQIGTIASLNMVFLCETIVFSLRVLPYHSSIFASLYKTVALLLTIGTYHLTQVTRLCVRKELDKNGAFICAFEQLN